MGKRTVSRNLGGRPPLPVAERRTERVTINLTRAECAALERAAGKRQTASDFARDLVLERVKPGRLSSDDRLLAEARRIVDEMRKFLSRYRQKNGKRIEHCAPPSGKSKTFPIMYVGDLRRTFANPPPPYDVFVRAFNQWVDGHNTLHDEKHRKK